MKNSLINKALEKNTHAKTTRSELLEVKSLSVGYGQGDVLAELSFTQKGGSMCILGPNGCGKTTLLKAIAGLLPYRGEVSLNGEALSSMKRHVLAKKIALMSQISSVYFSYSVFETVMLGRYTHMKGLFTQPRKSDQDYAEHCLEIVGCKDIRDNQITALSGGQLQRVFLARTLAQEPSLILLDEPTNHLDLKHQLSLLSYLKEWAQEEGHMLLGVLHDINLAMQLTDHFLLMNQGKIVALGKSRELCGDTLNQIYGINVKEYMLNTLKLWETCTDSSFMN